MVIDHSCLIWCPPEHWCIKSTIYDGTKLFLALNTIWIDTLAGLFGERSYSIWHISTEIPHWRGAISRSVYRTIAYYISTNSASTQCPCSSINFPTFLALLDSVSRVHGMGLLWDFCLSSVVHLCCNYLWTECTDFFQILVVASPGPYADTFFERVSVWPIHFQMFYDFFVIFVNMGTYGSENLKTVLLLYIAAESFQTFLNFLTNCPHKITFGIFDILKIEILMNFLPFC